MKVSYNWLQTYFEKPLPSPEKLAELLTLNVFEIEGIEKVDDDAVLDVKVLPDRAYYALSHEGVAREISLLTDLEKQPISATMRFDKYDDPLDPPSITVLEPELCQKYVGVRIENISVGKSPELISKKLETIGQRSINSIVDILNYVLFDMGQPLHAFDADKMKGSITVRKAKKGEKMTTLDGKDLTLEDWMLVVADDEGPLALAGIKGGNKAAVTESTKNIILEAANFNPALIRKTSNAVGIKNDSSKRFENAVPASFTGLGAHYASALIRDANEQARESLFQEVGVDFHENLDDYYVTFTVDYVQEILGMPISTSDIKRIIEKMGFTIHSEMKGTFRIYINPPYKDLLLLPRLVGEIGRIYGYEKIPATTLPKSTSKPKVNKIFYWTEKIKDILIEHGFSEVMTYSLQSKGEVELANALASDKGYLRANLERGIKESLELNARNADLLGLEQIKIFEIGRVFTKEKGEYPSFALGIKNIKKQKRKESEELQETIRKISEALGVQGLEGKLTENVFEANLDEYLESLPEPKPGELFKTTVGHKKYEPISSYPFAVRDIAVFVPENISEKEVEKIIIEKSGKLLVRKKLFDVFTKNQKTSYAFRLVFQSHEKTLTEDEINTVMKKITDEMNGGEGWQVR